jgi:hypothetical protein
MTNFYSIILKNLLFSIFELNMEYSTILLITVLSCLSCTFNISSEEEIASVDIKATVPNIEGINNEWGGGVIVK